MDSGMIGKIQKAHEYAKDRDRFRFDAFQVTLRGSNQSHVVSYNGGVWHCTCHFFSQRGVCSHSMALEKILDGMVAIAPINTPVLEPA